MHVRSARPEDYDAWLAFWSYLDIDANPSTRDRFVTGIAPSTIFFEEDGVLAAYGLSFSFGSRGDVRQVAVAPAFRKRGLGTQLMGELATRLRAKGATDWRLEVLADNAPAIALYRSVGMTKLRDVYTVMISREQCERFAVPGACAPVTPDDDARLEAALDLGAGQIDRWRTFRPTSPLVRIGGVAMIQVNRDFAPDRGFLFPFLAPTVAIAQQLMCPALVDAPAQYEVQLPGGPIHEALLAAGARPLEHLFELGGPLAT